jgi:tetratricopeptide (TPR) repeat protein
MHALSFLRVAQAARIATVFGLFFLAASLGRCGIAYAENGAGRAVASVAPMQAGARNLELARKYFEMGRLRQANTYLTEAAKAYDQEASSIGKFETYWLLGNVYALEDLHSQALQYHYKAEQVAADLKMPKPLADAYLALGQDLLALKDPAQAAVYLEKSIKLYIDVKALPQAASAELYFGDACMARRQFVQAEVAFRQSIDISQQADDIRGKVLATERLARSLQQQHLYADAINELQIALTLADDAQMPDEKANIFLDLTECYAKSGKKDKAIFYGKIGLSLAIRFKSLVQQERANLLLHTTYKELNNSVAALEHYKAYVTLRDRIGNDLRNRQLTEMRLRYQLNMARLGHSACTYCINKLIHTREDTNRFPRLRPLSRIRQRLGKHISRHAIRLDISKLKIFTFVLLM